MPSDITTDSVFNKKALTIISVIKILYAEKKPQDSDTIYTTALMTIIACAPDVSVHQSLVGQIPRPGTRGAKFKKFLAQKRALFVDIEAPITGTQGVPIFNVGLTSTGVTLFRLLLGLGLAGVSEEKVLNKGSLPKELATGIGEVDELMQLQPGTEKVAINLTACEVAVEVWKAIVTGK